MLHERIKVNKDEQYLTINDQKVRIYLSNNDNKQKANIVPLLVCNGLGMSIETIVPFTKLFANRTIIHFDVPAVGKSSLPFVPLSLENYTDITKKMITALGYDQVDMLGISWGGILAQEFTRQYPQKVNKLILSVTSAGYCVTIPSPFQVMMGLTFPLCFFNQYYRDLIAGPLYGGVVHSQPRYAQEHDKRNINPNIYGYFSQLVATGGWASVPWLHTLEHETLVISGKHDSVIPSINQQVLASLIPNATLQVINCGHLLMVTKAAEVSALVKEFLGEPLAEDAKAV
jgi:poly(3-hydroxyalkanoate) depolymerase